MSEDTRYTYLFLLKYDHEGAVLDDCLDLSRIAQAGVSAEDALLAAKVAYRLTGEMDEEMSQLGRQVNSINLRSRFDGACEGPFLVHVPNPLTREELQTILRDPAILRKIREGGKAR